MTLRVFLEPSGYRWQNLGDAAMAEVALARLRAAWPDAQIVVHSSAPEAIGETALDPAGSVAWNKAGPLARVALRIKGRDPGLVQQYLDAVDRADLVVVSGAGSINDAFRTHALRVLATLARAQAHGAVTAMMGQGIGPMSDAKLRRRAAEVLPRVDLIALRERVTGPPLLESLGVPRERIVVTGDDAIEVALAAAPARGTAIGIGVRVASYAAIGHDELTVLDAALPRDVPAIALPIAPDDAAAIRRVRPGAHAPDVTTIPQFLAAMRQCRVVVSGSYHAAVFALASGIPAVTFANSDYYRAKFRGLAGEFGAACHVVPLERDALRRAIEAAWETPEDVRMALIECARAQAARSREAWQRLVSLGYNAAARRAL